MIYLDNAATSRYKPKCVFDALYFDITHSTNSGRSGHHDALDAGMRIEKCRNYLLSILGAQDGYEIVFTKNCTEALNLAIFGYIKGGEKVVSSMCEHNSVLRPLEFLRDSGKIDLHIVPCDEDNCVDYHALIQMLDKANLLILGGASNVTGTCIDIEKVGRMCREKNVKFLLDGAQSVPIVPIDMTNNGIDFVACPGHKGLHGVQGTGFLAFKTDIELKPLLYGGTGTFSASLKQPRQAPEGLESGTQFSAGISALHCGAQWTMQNVEEIRKNTIRMAKNLIDALLYLGCKVYTTQTTTGVVSFNIENFDSTMIAEKLDEYGIAVRSGLHCAPLMHKQLDTLSQGAVRVSIGCDTTDKETLAFCTAMEKIIVELHK